MTEAAKPKPLRLERKLRKSMFDLHSQHSSDIIVGDGEFLRRLLEAKYPFLLSGGLEPYSEQVRETSSISRLASECFWGGKPPSRCVLLCKEQLPIARQKTFSCVWWLSPEEH